jgi:hypothetical protein
VPGLLIKDVPVELHRRLKELARSNRRSMTKQALVLLERGLGEGHLRISLRDVQPVRAKVTVTDELIEQAVRQGRP